VTGKDKAQALAETRTIPECDRLSAIEVTPQRAALGMLAELCPEGRGVGESEAEQAALISLHRHCGDTWTREVAPSTAVAIPYPIKQRIFTNSRGHCCSNGTIAAVVSSSEVLICVM